VEYPIGVPVPRGPDSGILQSRANPRFALTSRTGKIYDYISKADLLAGIFDFRFIAISLNLYFAAQRKNAR